MSEKGLPCHEEFKKLLEEATRAGASDIHIASGENAWLRINGAISPLQDSFRFNEDDMQSLASSLAGNPGAGLVEKKGSYDGALTDQQGQRYRFNLYRCGGNWSVALRRLDSEFLTLEQLGLPGSLKSICEYKNGLVLVAGPTGSGKSTTLATLLNQINLTRAVHIVTIEDPVEFIHKPIQSRISQRQVGRDTPDFSNALIDAVRQDPDVILVGELRDLETIRTAVTAAETGHLVFATVHAGDTVSAIERIITVFPGNEQAVIRNLLSGSLRTVIAQHLLVASEHKKNDSEEPKRRVLASELLHINAAASNQIATNNLQQLQSILELGRADGMQTLDFSLASLWRKGEVSERTARSLARNPDMLREMARALQS